MKTLETFFQDTLDITGYAGNKVSMYADAMKFAKDMQLESLLTKIDTIPLPDIMKHLMSEGENASKILKAFLENATTKTKLEFFAALEHNDALLHKIITGEHADIFIRKI